MTKKVKLSFYYILFVIVLTSFMVSCKDTSQQADAYGNFEAEETIISSEIGGKVVNFDIKTGQKIDKDNIIGMIDTLNLYYRKQQVISKINIVKSKFASIIAEVSVIEEKINTLKKDRERIENLLKAGASTQKQLDDINGQINILEKQITTVKSKNASIFAELDAVKVELDLINYQISKAIIRNPLKGVVLEKYVQKYEMVNIGSPLYKIANLDEMILRAYISGNQLADFKIGQEVNVFIDIKNNDVFKYKGEIVWVSSEAEFTPKIIQTKEERVKLVYAIKVKVKNDGKIKIGAPGEVCL